MFPATTHLAGPWAVELTAPTELLALVWVVWSFSCSILMTPLRSLKVSVRFPNHPAYSVPSVLTSSSLVIMSTYLYWSTIELGLAVTAACLPTLKPALNSISLSRISQSLSSLFSSSSSRTTRSPKHRQGEGSGATSIGSAEMEKDRAARDWHRFHKGTESDIGTSVTAIPDGDVMNGDMPAGKIIVESGISSRVSAV